MLHPAHAFEERKTPLVRWLKSCGGLLGSQTLPKTCRRLSLAVPNQEIRSSSLSGVVDLCPCVRLTPAKRDRIQGLHNEVGQNGPFGRDRKHGHNCLLIYGDIRLSIILIPFLYKEDGELSFRFHYQYQGPVDFSSVCLEWCAHISPWIR